MFDHKVIVKKIDEVLHLTKNALTKDLIEDISTCAHCGEETIAFENLCSNLYEYEPPISRQAYELLKDIGLSLNVEKRRWKVLESQIRSENS